MVQFGYLYTCGPIITLNLWSGESPPIRNEFGPICWRRYSRSLSTLAIRFFVSWPPPGVDLLNWNHNQIPLFIIFITNLIGKCKAQIQLCRVIRSPWKLNLAKVTQGRGETSQWVDLPLVYIQYFLNDFIFLHIFYIKIIIQMTSHFNC